MPKTASWRNLLNNNVLCWQELDSTCNTELQYLPGDSGDIILNTSLNGLNRKPRIEQNQHYNKVPFG